MSHWWESKFRSVLTIFFYSLVSLNHALRYTCLKLRWERREQDAKDANKLGLLREFYIFLIIYILNIILSIKNITNVIH